MHIYVHTHSLQSEILSASLHGINTSLTILFILYSSLCSICQQSKFLFHGFRFSSYSRCSLDVNQPWFLFLGGYLHLLRSVSPSTFKSCLWILIMLMFSISGLTLLKGKMPLYWHYNYLVTSLSIITGRQSKSGQCTSLDHQLVSKLDNLITESNCSVSQAQGGLHRALPFMKAINDL